MKLSKVEKIIVGVILLGLILVGGAFMFVVPSFQQIEKNNKVLTANLQEKAELDTTLARLDTIDADIESSKTEARKAEGGFYPDLTSYEASELAMAYMKAANLESHEISVSSMSTRAFSLEYFVPVEVEYDLKTSAAAAKDTEGGSDEIVEGEFTDGGKKYKISVNSVIEATITDSEGNEIAPAKYSDTMKKVYKAAICKAVASGGTSQTVGIIQADYEVKGKYSDYVKFIDHIYDLGRATMFDTVKFPVTVTIDEEQDSKAMFVGEDGTLSVGSEANGKMTLVNDNTIIKEPLTIYFLCAEPMESLKNVDADGTKIVVDQRPKVY